MANKFTNRQKSDKVTKIWKLNLRLISNQDAPSIENQFQGEPADDASEEVDEDGGHVVEDGLFRELVLHGPLPDRWAGWIQSDSLQQ